MQESKNEKVNEYERALGFRPRLALYHANPKGTGCAIKMELHTALGMEDGGIFCTFANQKTVGCRLGNPPTFPTFDWDNAITENLDFNDLSKMMQVFRGECESVWSPESQGTSNATSTRPPTASLTTRTCGWRSGASSALGSSGGIWTPESIMP